MTTSIDIGTLITHTPDVCGDRPRIAGTRVMVGRIATLWKSGLAAEQIADQIEHLTLAQIHAALAYFHANQEEIETLLLEDAQEYERLMGLRYGSGELG